MRFFLKLYATPAPAVALLRSSAKISSTMLASSFALIGRWHSTTSEAFRHHTTWVQLARNSSSNPDARRASCQGRWPRRSIRRRGAGVRLLDADELRHRLLLQILLQLLDGHRVHCRSSSAAGCPPRRAPPAAPPPYRRRRSCCPCCLAHHTALGSRAPLLENDDQVYYK